MGFLDAFLNQNDPQSQGLLAAAAQMLQQSGPSLMPHSFGQVLGSGMNAYQQTSQQAQQHQLDQMLRSLQLQEAQGSLTDKAKARSDALAAQAWLRDYNAPKASPMPAPQSADSMFRSGMNGDLSPAQAMPSAATAQAIDPFKQHMAQAQAMRQSGIPSLMAQADKLEEQALKFREEFSTTPQVVNGPNGPVLIQASKFGADPKILPYTPRDKLELANLGGKDVAYNPFDLKPGQTFQRTQSPDSMAVDRRERDKGPAVDPTQVENVANLIANGRMAPLGQMAMRSPYGAAVMSRVAEINPTFRAQDFTTSTKSERDFATGKQGNSVRSFNVSISHLDTLGQLADALSNGNVQAINKIGNAFSQQTGNPAPTNFDAAKKIVADEVVKAIVGSGGGVHDREEAARVISSANSPAQLKGVIKTYQDLMVGQLSGLEQQYRTTTQRDDFSKYLSPQAQSMFHPAGQPAPAAASPGAKTVTLSDIAATAKASGKSTAEVTAALSAKGYTIGGQ